jgi:tetratricopeptide (TPR) repeat protein
MNPSDDLRCAKENSQRGKALLQQGNYTEALEAFEQAAEGYARQNHLAEQAVQLQAMAEIHQLRQHHDQAQSLYERLVPLYDQLQDKPAKAAVVSNLGLFKAFKGDFTNALKYFQQARDLFERIGDQPSLARIWGNIGSVYRDMQAPAEAMPNYQKALEIYTQLHDDLGCADQSANIGYLNAVQGDASKALDWFRKALGRYQALGETEKARLTQQNIARLESRESAGA